MEGILGDASQMTGPPVNVEQVMRESFTGSWLDDYPSGRAQLAIARSLDLLHHKIDQLLRGVSMASDQLMAAFEALSQHVDNAEGADAHAEIMDVAEQVKGLQPGAALSAEQIAGISEAVSALVIAVTPKGDVAVEATVEETPAEEAAVEEAPVEPAPGEMPVPPDPNAPPA